MAMKLLSLVLILALIQFNSATYAPDFQATFVKAPPGVIGFQTGTVSYSQTWLSIRYDYDPLGSYYEIWNYNTSNQNSLFVYKACTGKCDIEPQSNAVLMPIWTYVAGDSCAATTTTVRFGTCYMCTQPAASKSVTSYCIKDMTSYQPIQITLLDTTVIDLNTITIGGSASLQSEYTPATSWNCTLNCGAVADIALVVDESGSITDCCKWPQLAAFVKAFVAGFTINSNAIGMGLTFFSTGARIQLPIIFDQTAMNNAVNPLVRENYGTTWIGAGVLYGNLILQQSPRTNVPKIIVLITDGISNAPNPFNWLNQDWNNGNSPPTSNLQWLGYVQNPPYNNILVDVGVGTPPLINPTYLASIASLNVSGDPMFYYVTSFNNLVNQELINDITRTVCTSSSPADNCPSCNGVCTCGTCSCPSTCDDGNMCHVGVCSSSQNNGGGCLYSPTNCDDSNACTTDTCDPTTGCIYTPIACNDNNVCTTDTCSPTVGCVFTPISCDDNNACTADTCDPKAGCQHTNISCNSGNLCNIDGCNPSVGCTSTPKTCYANPCLVQACDSTSGTCKTTQNLCQNLNPCTFNNGTPNVFYPIDCTQGTKCISPACNPSSTNKYNGCYNTSVDCSDGSACTTDSCNNQTGCINTPIKCDDDDACTVDSCNAQTGCVHTPLVCNDNNNCTTDTCNSSGCVFTPTNCSDDNACTIDTCDSTTGCIHTPIQVNITCNDGTVCTIDSCDPNIGCVHTLINCTVPGQNTTTSTNSTYSNITTAPCKNFASCDPIRGCIVTQKCNTTINNGLSCSVIKCDSNGQTETGCSSQKITSGACAAIIAAGLSAGIIAAIVIAALACVGGAAGGAYALNQFVFKGEFTNQNALYQPETQTVTNPAFNRQSVFNQAPGGN